MKRRPSGSPKGGQFAPDRGGKKPPEIPGKMGRRPLDTRTCPRCGNRFTPAANVASNLQECLHCQIKHVARLYAENTPEKQRPTPLSLPGTPQQYHSISQQQDVQSHENTDTLPSRGEPQETGNESQAHGLAFEQQISSIFFNDYEIKRDGALWDIPAEANVATGVLAEKYLHLPVSIKSRGSRNAIWLGDAARQRRINEPFIIMLVDYDQTDEETKTPTSIQVERVSPEMWERMWGPISIEHIEELDAIVKDRSLDHMEARKRAKEWLEKNANLLRRSVFNLSAKIDSKNQRRVQCTISIAHFRRLFPPRLYHNGQPIPLVSVNSPPRSTA